MTSKQLSILDNFAKELEEFARTTEGQTRAPGPVATRTPSEARTSVRTVQELLPYRQQFRDAGLAVTSADQKVPPKSESCAERFVASLTYERLRFDGGAGSSQASSPDTKELFGSSIVGLGEQDPMSLVSPALSVERHPTEINLATSPTLESLRPVSSGGVRNAMAFEKRVSQTRYSAVSLMNKPLPARPGSFGPKPVEPIASPRRSFGSTTVAVRKEFFTQRHERDLPETPSDRRSASMLPRSQTSVQVARDSIDTKKSDKALPDLPASHIPPQGRSGVNSPGQPAWAPAPRQVPMTILEEKEPSCQINSTSIQREMPLRMKDNNIPLQAANRTSSRLDTKTKSADPNPTNKPEPLSETREQVTGTPPSFKKALDDVVRKLEDMEDGDKKPVTDAVKAPPRRGSLKAPSTAQRLQRASAMRRERLGGTSGQHVEPSERLKTSAPTPVRTSRKPSVRLRAGATGVKESKTTGDCSSAQVQVLPPDYEDKDISDSDVLQGLKIICAASADHAFDAWIQSKTGLRLRRFLADLKTFEDLTEDGILAVGDPRVARRRKSERRKRQGDRIGTGIACGSVKRAPSRAGSVKRQTMI